MTLGAFKNVGNWDGYRVPFLYASNGEIIWYIDVRNPKNINRQIANFHTSDALHDIFTEDLSEGFEKLISDPTFIEGLRPYQQEAVEAVESAITKGKRAMLLAMATGTGKTFTTVSLIYRLLEAGAAHRILFLVDRRALAAQAVREVARYAYKHEEETGLFPKILIYAVNDLPHTSHCDQLLKICKEEFGHGDDFVKKITGSPSVDRPLQKIREFRNRPNPKIAITVDMLTTGVDIPALEFLVFLRPVKSRILWVQMLGRGTRRCSEKTLQRAHQLVYKKSLFDIISMVKHGAIKETPLLNAGERVDMAMARVMEGKTFTREQRQWLNMIREHMVENLTIEMGDFDNMPVFERQGGYSKARKLFGEYLQLLIQNINYAVAA